MKEALKSFIVSDCGLSRRARRMKRGNRDGLYGTAIAPAKEAGLVLVVLIVAVVVIVVPLEMKVVWKGRGGQPPLLFLEGIYLL